VHAGGTVKPSLTVFLLVAAGPYSSEVQQPMRATAVLGSHQHTRWAAPFDRKQGRASSLHPDGWPHWPALAAQRQRCGPMYR